MHTAGTHFHINLEFIKVNPTDCPIIPRSYLILRFSVTLAKSKLHDRKNFIGKWRIFTVFLFLKQIVLLLYRLRGINFNFMLADESSLFSCTLQVSFIWLANPVLSWLRVIKGNAVCFSVEGTADTAHGFLWRRNQPCFVSFHGRAWAEARAPSQPAMLFVPAFLAKPKGAVVVSTGDLALSA